jgi:hypothetical protein
MRIWKYEIPMDKDITINMPKWAQILHIGMQNGVPCMWVEIPSDSFYTNSEVVYEDRNFTIIGTGWEFGRMEIGNAGIYVGTWQNPPFVWHLYEYAQEEFPYNG